MDMKEQQIRAALEKHWSASAAGDLDAEHDIYAGGRHKISATHLMRHPGEPNGSNRFSTRSKLLPLPSDFVRGCNKNVFSVETVRAW